MKPEDILRIMKLHGVKELPADDPEFSTGPQIHFLSHKSRAAGQTVKQPTDRTAEPGHESEAEKTSVTNSETPTPSADEPVDVENDADDEENEDDENDRGREDCPVCDQSNKPLEGKTCCHFVGMVFDDNDIEPPVSNIISAWHSLAEKKVHEAPRVVLLALASRIGVSAETIDALLESGSYFENDQSQREFLDELCTALDLEQGELFSQTQGMLSGSCFSLYAKDPALLEKIAAESKLLDDAIT